MGYSRKVLARPIIGIANSASGFNNCHRHFPELIEAVKRGVLAAGGLPVDFPTISLGEVFLSPTSMLYRNLMSMDVEEMIRAQPMDAVVLLGGCDKTVPAQLMGAASAGRARDPAGRRPDVTGRHQGERLGACTDCRRFWARTGRARSRARRSTTVERQLATTAGTCGVMGTASTMACSPRRSAWRCRAPPRSRPCTPTGCAPPRRPAGSAVRAGRLRRVDPAQIMTPAAIENALRVLLAIGGSTNAIIHLTAMAGRARRADRSATAERAERDDPGAGGSQADRPALHGGLHAAGGVRRRAARAASTSSTSTA